MLGDIQLGVRIFLKDYESLCLFLKPLTGIPHGSPIPLYVFEKGLKFDARRNQRRCIQSMNGCEGSVFLFETS
jgi:hypothetical protein